MIELVSKEEQGEIVLVYRVGQYGKLYQMLEPHPEILPGNSIYFRRKKTFCQLVYVLVVWWNDLHENQTVCWELLFGLQLLV